MPVTDTSPARALLEQEDSLQFDAFTPANAFDIGCLLIEAAKRQSKSVMVEIRCEGRQFFQHAMQGTDQVNVDWIRRKNNVVSRFGRSSLFVHHQYFDGEQPIEGVAALDAAEFAAFGGAFPLRVRGRGVVGSITVSGLPHEEDHAMVVEVLARFLKPA